MFACLINPLVSELNALFIKENIVFWLVNTYVGLSGTNSQLIFSFTFFFFLLFTMKSKGTLSLNCVQIIAF